MKFFLCLLALSLNTQAQTTSFNFERSKLDPTYDEPTLDGTDVPVEEINTAPSPVPQYEEALPGTIVPEEEAVDEKRPEKKTKRVKPYFQEEAAL
jgi:hypothetical protein